MMITSPYGKGSYLWKITIIREIQDIGTYFGSHVYGCYLRLGKERNLYNEQILERK